MRVGVLFDYPQGDGGEYFVRGLRLGGLECDVVVEQTDGLPAGTVASVSAGFDRLVADPDVRAIVGPSISDNGIHARDWADEAEIPAINFTGGALTRSEWMFHYQVGSLEEEPGLLAAHLADRGLPRITVVHDDTPVGTNYLLWLHRSARVAGIEVVAEAPVSPLATDVTAEIEAAIGFDPDAVLYLGLGVAARATALALAAVGWDRPVAANSALMFAYGRRDWRAGWDDWTYADTVSDGNHALRLLAERSPAHAKSPIGAAARDIGSMLAEAIRRADDDSRAGLRDGLERVKRLPAASGKEGTHMGFGTWDHAALKGDYLVLRAWRDGRTVEV